MKFNVTRTSGRFEGDPDTLDFTTLEQLCAWVRETGGQVVLTMSGAAPWSPQSCELEIYDDYRE